MDHNSRATSLVVDILKSQTLVVSMQTRLNLIETILQASICRLLLNRIRRVCNSHILRTICLNLVRLLELANRLSLNQT